MRLPFLKGRVDEDSIQFDRIAFEPDGARSERLKSSFTGYRLVLAGTLEKTNMVRALSISVLAATAALVVPAAAAADAAPTANPVCHPVHRHHVALHARTAVVHRDTSSGLGVVIDQARLVAFPKPVKTVYVGNPTVVDVSMIDSQHAFLLGKTFGVTNMVALAADGNQVSNQQVTVLNNGSAVTINRGAEQFNYTCGHAHCETAPRPGDAKDYVSATESATSQHENTANQAGTNASPAQQVSN